jgi:YlmC/YmxH family sporulation protein
MRLSDFANKKIINLFDGEIMGMAGDSDLLIEPGTGVITGILAPSFRGKNGLVRGDVTIPWDVVRKIGAEVIVVDIEYY